MLARVDRRARHATECNHTATHLLQAALRETRRQSRAPGGLLRGPGQAALRLQPRAGAERAGAARRRGPRQRVDRANDPVRAITTTLDEAQAPRRDGAVRREVRRRGADGARSARASTRASCAAARTCAARPRSGRSGSSRDLQLGERAPHRGASRAPRRSSCCASTTACSARSPRSCAPARRTRPQTVAALAQERKRLEKALKQGAGAGAGAGGAAGDVGRRLARRAGRGRRGREGAHRERRGRRREGAARRRRPCEGSPRRRGDPARHAPPTGACTWWRAWRPSWSSAA